MEQTEISINGIIILVVNSNNLVDQNRSLEGDSEQEYTHKYAIGRNCFGSGSLYTMYSGVDRAVASGYR